MEGTLLGIGNPLLDISADVQPDLLEKYEVKSGDACLAEEKHKPLYEELEKNYTVDYIAGGAAQNSIRACQWLLQTPHASAYIGSVGKDDHATKLREAAEKENVSVHYYATDEAETGTCAVLVTPNKDRSLVANLAAANKYNKSHWDSEAIQEVVHKAQFYYFTSFFLTVSPDTLLSLGEHALATNKPVLMNLAAPFLIQFFWDPMSQVLPYADVIFANETEAAAFGEKQGWGTDLKEVALKLATWEKKNDKRERTVIFTQGAEQTLVASGGKVTEFTPIKIEKEKIVDTNGAGDSFVGGFLAGYVQNKPVEQCVAAAHYVACECIQVAGAAYPGTPTFKFDA